MSHVKYCLLRTTAVQHLSTTEEQPGHYVCASEELAEGSCCTFSEKAMGMKSGADLERENALQM